MLEEVIKFYRPTGRYGFLSNLYKKKLVFEDIEFPTAEHAYQYGKFRDLIVRDWAMKAPKPHLLSILAHGLFKWDITENWNNIKVDRMYEILQVKFSDSELKQKLLETGNAILIEDSKMDAFWGIGKKGTGKNMLGTLLMKIRDRLQDPFFCSFAEKNDYCSYYCDKCENHPECDYWDE